MISIEEATTRVAQNTPRLSAITVRREKALGSVLAESLVSDVDSPPHDKSLVDGYAVTAADVAQGNRSLRVLETIMAGCLPQQKITSGTTSRIMTGAPLPRGADAVVMHEQTDAGPPRLPNAVTATTDDDRVTILTPNVGVGQNILRRGTSFSKGATILSAGRMVTPIDAGLLADIGCGQVSVFRRPTVAILSTGDELVPPDVEPSPGQIRSSNESLLAGLVLTARAHPICLGIAKDARGDLSTLIEKGFQHDMLILSGGVSAGDLDLVPATLQSLGVQQVFHGVHLRPGKPVWFGVRSTPERRTLVFGLPGNPVSVLVCFKLFVRQALRAMGGETSAAWPSQTVRLGIDHHNRSGRPTFYPAQITFGDNDQPAATLLPWHGSADLCSLRKAHGFVFFPADQSVFSAGSSLRFFFLDDLPPATS